MFCRTKKVELVTKQAVASSDIDSMQVEKCSVEYVHIMNCAYLVVFDRIVCGKVIDVLPKTLKQCVRITSRLYSILWCCIEDFTIQANNGIKHKRNHC